jgi:LacI family transcriptional regulator
MSHLRSTRPASFKAVLGAILDYPAPHGIADLPSHIRFRYEGFVRRAGEYGYQVEAFNLKDPSFASVQRLDRALFNRNIPGFVITGLSHPREMLQGMNLSRYAVVALGHSMLNPYIHRVAMNTTLGFKLVIDRAFALGYRRIGVASSVEYDRRTNHGLLMPASHAKLNLKRGTSVEILKVSETGDKEIASIARWLRQTKPEFAFGPGVYEAIQYLGWNMPGDIAFATFDRSPGFPEHAGLDQRHEALGRLAGDVLVSEITQNRRGIPSEPVEHTIQGCWVDSATAPPRTLAEQVD